MNTVIIFTKNTELLATSLFDVPRLQFLNLLLLILIYKVYLDLYNTVLVNAGIEK